MMNQIMSWICLISICFLALQVMIFLCENTVKEFNNIVFNKYLKNIMKT